MCAHMLLSAAVLCVVTVHACKRICNNPIIQSYIFHKIAWVGRDPKNNVVLTPKFCTQYREVHNPAQSTQSEIHRYP